MKKSLTIGWLYPDLMSTYGDRGNILVLQKRCEWRGISVEIVPIDQKANDKRLMSIDLIFGGGAQDKAQEIVMKDLKGKKADLLKEKIEHNIPSLFVCGSPQLMGTYYEPSIGQRIEGVGIFDMVSIHPGPDKPRLIGNIVGEVLWENLTPSVIARKESKTTDEAISYDNGVAASVVSGEPPRNVKAQALYVPRNDRLVVGFENHGGRTYLGKNARPFAKVLKGFGNNGEDGTEGVVYKNAIGCYFHGPLLPKNPHIADFLIQRALEVKYSEEINLKPLDDLLEYKAQKVIAERLGVTI